MTENATGMRCARNDQVVATGGRFSKNLVEHDSVPNTHFGGDSELFEIFLLLA